MPSPKWNLKMLRDYIVGDQISAHHGVFCYPAIRRSTEEKYMLKAISVPASSTQLEALLLTGALADNDAAKTYFSQRAHELLEQAEILQNLSQQEGFVPYVDSQIVEMEDQIGFHVCLLGTYKQSLARVLSSDTMTHADVLNMGLDLCAALAACRRAGYIYADLKPENIFYDAVEGFRIGDVGFIALSSLKYTSLPGQYRSSYTAPELLDDFAVVNTTVDTFALGLVLYRAYNGGTLPFTGSAPGEVLPPAMYADYELAEIISKACHPDPAQRWQDPTQMAQALISYMQTYGCAETPIVPPVIETLQEEPEVEDFLPEADPAQLQAEMDALDQEQPEELAFLSELVNDETAPSEESAAFVSEDVLSEETSHMLAQADMLIMHPLPDPVVAPEPIVLEMETEPAIPAQEPDPSQMPKTAEETVTDMETTQTPEDAPAQAADTLDVPAADTPQSDESAAKRKFRFPWRIVVLAAIVLILLCCGYCGKYYYDHIYTLRVDALSVDYAGDSVTVTVDSTIDPSLLKVVCTDSYGNSRESAVADGIAVFSDLKPGVHYTVRVEVDGRHRLIGTTADSFTTDIPTQILSFMADMGPEDCSVSLYFTRNGPEPENWIIRYSAEGTEEKTHTFSGHDTVISGLEAGKAYTFTLTSQENLYITGQNQVTYLATNILYAQDLTITACSGGNLTVQWQQPEDGHVSMWHIRCYNDAGFNASVTTSDLFYTFTDIDHSHSYTVEVTAAGMPESVSTEISANPITVENFTCQFTEQMVLQVDWDFAGLAPEGGWLLHYSIDGGDVITVALAQPQATILAIPGGNYVFTVECADGRFVFGQTQTYTLSDIAVFAGYGVSAGDMAVSMCLWPAQDLSDWSDIPQENYRTEFTCGDSVGFVIGLQQPQQSAEDQIHVQFVLHDANGLPLRLDSTYLIWNGMWHDGHCCLQMPYTVETAGSYTVCVYFDGTFVFRQDFTIT